MKFTLEHAIILILAIALIYYVVKHRNLLTDLFRIPERGHPELKSVKDKHQWYGAIFAKAASGLDQLNSIR